MKLCSRLLVLYCRNCPKDDTFRYLIHPHFQEFRGGVGPRSVARWKALVDCLLTVIMAALRSRYGHYIFLPREFFLLSIFYLFYSSPNLSGRRLDVYHTSTHGVALVRI